MKTLALLTILALNTTQLWPHLPENTRTNLTRQASSLKNAPAGIAPATTPFAPAGQNPQTPLAPSPIGPLPIRMSTEAANINAPSALALDLATGTVLYSKNAAAKRPIASVTKLITALVILSRHKPEELATLPALPPYGPYDERLGLAAGETYRIGDLVQAALIKSGNDAADALALYDAGTMPRFAAQMNTKMSQWGISDTRFNNPTGLIDDGNYSTAEALGKIAGLALTNPFIRQTIAKSEGTITSTGGHTISFTSTNKLLATGQFYGIKTGYTPAAGECFVGLTRVNGHEVVTVILGSTDRFGATQDLTNWISRNYQWL